MKLSKEERHALTHNVEDLSAFMAVQKALEIIDAQHAALVAVRKYADLLAADSTEDENDEAFGVDSDSADCFDVAQDLYAFLNGQGVEEEEPREPDSEYA